MRNYTWAALETFGKLREAYFGAAIVSVQKIRAHNRCSFHSARKIQKTMLELGLVEMRNRRYRLTCAFPPILAKIEHIARMQRNEIKPKFPF